MRDLDEIIRVNKEATDNPRTKRQTYHKVIDVVPTMRFGYDVYRRDERFNPTAEDLRSPGPSDPVEKLEKEEE